MSLPLLHAGRTNPGLSAALDLRFALDKSLTAYRGPTPSFSRASTGSYFDVSGVLRYATVNILTYSENFSDASWLKNSTTISSDSVIAPDGKTTADTLTSTSSTAIHYLEKTGYTVSTVQYTISIFAKYGTHRYLQISANNESSGVYANFDLFSGVVGSVGASATSQITNVGGGWYRCSMTYTSTNTASRPLLVMVSSSTAPRVESTTLTSGDYFYIWGCQQEASSTVGTYCPTTSSANSAPRFDHTYNGTSWVSRGLLVEEQRTNQVPNSEAFSNWTAQSGSTVTDASVNGPKGSNTASIINEGNLSVDYKGIFQILGNSVAAVYSFSVFAKYNNLRYIAIQVYDGPTSYATSIFDLLNGSNTATTSSGNWSSVLASSTDCGNGWYRLSMQVTSSGAVTIVTAIRPANAGTGFSASYGAPAAYTGTNRTSYIFGAQLEQGSFPTSYIPAITATTRSADVCQITGGDFSGFWNGTEGSLVLEYDRLAAITSGFSGGYPRYLTVDDGTLNNRMGPIGYTGSPSNEAFYAVTGGSSQGDTLIGASAAGGISQKIGFAYKANDAAASLNGASVVADTTFSVPTVTKMQIGYYDQSTTSPINGHIARLRYYRKRLPNQTLQLLSDPDPTLNLQFALNKSLTPVAGPAPSFSRASTGSYFDSTGTLKYANVNLFTYSEQFDNAAWTDKAGSTLYTNAAASPNGDLSADQLQLSNSGYYYQMKAYTTTGTHTFSVWLRSSSPTTTLLRLSNNASTESSVVTCNVTTSWQRFSVTRNWSANPVNFWAGLDQRTLVGGPGTSTNVFIWGAQLELASSPSQYAKTEASTTAGPRFDHVYSGGQWVSRGLLIEEQRTNSAQYSEDLSNAYWTKAGSTISANNANAPDGNLTADKVVETAANIQHTLYNSGFSVTAGSASTVSFYAKAAGRNFIQFPLSDAITGAGSQGRVNFDLSTGTIGQVVGTNLTAEIIDVGNGWYRCVVKSSSAVSGGTGYIQFNLVNSSTATPGQAYLGDGTSGVLVWGIQLENGSAFATSYIPSLSNSSTTRSADVCQITGTSFNWLWNQGEGSFVVNYDCPATGTLTQYQANSASSTNIHTAVSVGTTQYFQVYLPPEQALINAGSITANIPQSLSSAYKLNDFAASLNGASVVVDTSGSLPTPTKIIIGSDGSGYNNGHIAKLIYYPARLTNTKLQQLST